MRTQHGRQMEGNPAAGTGSADVLATTGKRSDGGGGW